MKSIINYIENVGNSDFLEEEFNEIDNLVLSDITYLDFDNIVNNKLTLYEVGKIFFNKYNDKDIKKEVFAVREAYEIFKSCYDKKRYKDILVYNYVYTSSNDTQFSALTFKLTKDLIYVGYEGTDSLISGWKEDFYMSYIFPVKAHEYAIDYLNNTIKLFDKNVIVGGHSKGGNLALVASMYANFFVRRKIKAIYNNDGPGLRKEELDTKYYKRVRDRYIHIVPNYSYVGILLRHDKFRVIKSNNKNILSHAISTWEIKDRKLVDEELSRLSKNLKDGIISWLDNHNYDERRKMLEPIFNIIEESKIYTLDDLKKSKNILTLIKNLNSIDGETKKIALDFFKYNVSYLVENIRD